MCASASLGVLPPPSIHGRIPVTPDTDLTHPETLLTPAALGGASASLGYPPPPASNQSIEETSSIETSILRCPRGEKCCVSLDIASPQPEIHPSHSDKVIQIKSISTCALCALKTRRLQGEAWGCASASLGDLRPLEFMNETPSCPLRTLYIQRPSQIPRHGGVPLRCRVNPRPQPDFSEISIDPRGTAVWQNPCLSQSYSHEPSCVSAVLPAVGSTDYHFL